jgi:hypothetical protein
MSGLVRHQLPLVAVLGALCLAKASAVKGAEQRITCPLTLDMAGGKGPPPGWRLVTQADARPKGPPAKLTTAGMLHGAPEEPGFLRPATSKGGKQGNRSRWVQSWKLPHWYETFVYCGYGEDAPLKLFHQVKDDANECTLKSSRTGGTVESMEFVCK